MGEPMHHWSMNCCCTGKFCSQCQEFLCLLAFHQDQTRRDGVHPTCKRCRALDRIAQSIKRYAVELRVITTYSYNEVPAISPHEARRIIREGVERGEVDGYVERKDQIEEILVTLAKRSAS